jgi:hypothetical protein
MHVKFALKIVVLCAVLAMDAVGMQLSNNYSPWNARRGIRKRTDYIILHTTEASLKGSLNELRLMERLIIWWVRTGMFTVLSTSIGLQCMPGAACGKGVPILICVR